MPKKTEGSITKGDEMGKPKKTADAASAATQPAAELPCWLNEEPEELRYSLECTHVTECQVWDQQIDITREEFIALKVYLAKLRGYVAPAASVSANA
jgi:hypothetical protein